MTLPMTRTFGAIVLAISAIAHPAAQTTGLIQGVVKDAQGKPVEGAKITIELTEGVNIKLETKSGKKGEFTQIGLQSGPHKVTAEKDKLSQSQMVRVTSGDVSRANFVLAPRAASGRSAEDANAAELQKTFGEGVEAARAGKLDDAIGKFSRGIELDPKCAECYYNLATLYNAQGKFEQAAAASLRGTEISAATGAGKRDPELMFTQGVILWNAGRTAEAKKQFEAAIEANPNHAEAHYRLGVALVSEGNAAAATGEFETYLKLAPTGPNAAAAREFLSQTRKK